jgi:hypothetical protein
MYIWTMIQKGCMCNLHYLKYKKNVIWFMKVYNKFKQVLYQNEALNILDIRTRPYL